MKFEYAFTTSVSGHNIIRLHFCNKLAIKWASIDIDTSTFDLMDAWLYKELDLPDFGKHYAERHNVHWVSKKEIEKLKNENK